MANWKNRKRINKWEMIHEQPNEMILVMVAHELFTDDFLTPVI